ncbi:delta-cadinene synthase isozyme XC14 [Gossypium arboreum]|uniref:Delta-cadinene synthase isozyme XC14 n=1 Tax=Gossypium arboreum TaxID=29729 RepID=A0A0B0MEU3_GOSAR|nr:delta-cadinene synthase isozyme XC14 [Gossypium arboreum]
MKCVPKPTICLAFGEISSTTVLTRILMLKLKNRHQQLKEEVRKMIVAPMANSIQKLTFIDSVQRLGVSYHFMKEIEDELENIYHNDNDAENDLYTTSLRFRLL